MKIFYQGKEFASVLHSDLVNLDINIIENGLTLHSTKSNFVRVYSSQEFPDGRWHALVGSDLFSLKFIQVTKQGDGEFCALFEKDVA